MHERPGRIGRLCSPTASQMSNGAPRASCRHPEREEILDEHAGNLCFCARMAAHHSVSPLFLHLDGADYRNDAAVKASGRRVLGPKDVAVFEWVERPAVPLALPPDLDPDELAARVMAEIEEIKRLALS